ncbi:MAG: hypothetical protein A2X86_01345 [Bdellovibrionales bacterium GWA2_49_15]|nr:MAG: hypothetical protein A2X86_01345 [Bdellovibrionales bacterium GWA2_49_15]
MHLFILLTLGLLSFQTLAWRSDCGPVFRDPHHLFLSETRYPSRGERLAHESIHRDLVEGHVVEGKPFSANNNRNALFKIKIFNPRTGQGRDALFKPRPFGDGFGWNRVPMEWVAYKINLLLGMDYIPPVSYRSKAQGNPVTINGETFAEGAALYMVPDAHELHKVPVREWESDRTFTPLEKEYFLSDVRIFDFLMQNPDRHINNFLRGRHWKDGVYRPILIDQAASLKGNATIDVLRGNDAFNSGAVSKIRPRTLEALRALKRRQLETLRPHLSDSEIDQILARRDQVLAYFGH